MSTRNPAPEMAGETPLHRRIAEILSQQVNSGRLRPGDNLPSEREIARQFQASRATVRTALQRLEQAGLITRRERRSAVVKVRRDLLPHLRLACSQPRLMQVLGRLGDLQLLPPRCQLQLVDLQQSGALAQLRQPATGADVLVCELEHIAWACGQPGSGAAGQEHPLRDLVAEPLRYLCWQGPAGTATPVAVSPQVVFTNRSLFAASQTPEPRAGWGWAELRSAAQRLTRGRQYGFQFRPTFTHLAALAASQGGSLYREDGKADGENAAMGAVLRMIDEMVRHDRVAPMLAKSDPINLFAEGRCAMALDGAEMLGVYREKLGASLAMAALPRAEQGRAGLGGFAVAVLGEPADEKTVLDLVRTLLAPAVQQALVRAGGGLPVRPELLQPASLESQGLPAEAARLLTAELGQCQRLTLPRDEEHKREVEKLVLELWLGMDTMEDVRQRIRQLAG